MKTITRDEAIELLDYHGLDARDQTGILNGKLLENGTSFIEQMGKKEDYVLADVLLWLGY